MKIVTTLVLALVLFTSNASANTNVDAIEVNLSTALQTTQEEQDTIDLINAELRRVEQVVPLVKLTLLNDGFITIEYKGYKNRINPEQLVNSNISIEKGAKMYKVLIDKLDQQSINLRKLNTQSKGN